MYPLHRALKCLKNESNALAATDAHGDESITLLLTPQSITTRQSENGSSRPEWVTKGDGVTHRVDLRWVDPHFGEIADHSNGLRGECFIEFHVVDIGAPNTGRSESLFFHPLEPDCF